MSGSQRRALAIVFGVVFLDLLGFSIVIPILPFYARTVGPVPMGALYAGVGFQSPSSSVAACSSPSSPSRSTSGSVTPANRGLRTPHTPAEAVRRPPSCRRPRDAYRPIASGTA
jgi:hypothetical protein